MAKVAGTVAALAAGTAAVYFGWYQRGERHAAVQGVVVSTPLSPADVVQELRLAVAETSTINVCGRELQPVVVSETKDTVTYALDLLSIPASHGFPGLDIKPACTLQWRDDGVDLRFDALGSACSVAYTVSDAPDGAGVAIGAVLDCEGPLGSVLLLGLVSPLVVQARLETLKTSIEAAGKEQ